MVNELAHLSRLPIERHRLVPLGYLNIDAIGLVRIPVNIDSFGILPRVRDGHNSRIDADHLHAVATILFEQHRIRMLNHQHTVAHDIVREVFLGVFSVRNGHFIEICVNNAKRVVQ